MLGIEQEKVLKLKIRKKIYFIRLLQTIHLINLMKKYLLILVGPAPIIHLTHQMKTNHFQLLPLPRMCLFALHLVL